MGTANALECYIEEVHSVDRVAVPFDKERAYVRVDVTSNSYGRFSRGVHHWTVEEWKKIQSNGYYMA